MVIVIDRLLGVDSDDKMEVVIDELRFYICVLITILEGVLLKTKRLVSDN
jgi:hypothetical protein